MNLLDSINTTIPLLSEPNGVIRIGNTRVTLETLIYQFKNGSTAEEIVFQYPVLDLGDVYAVIGFYLKNQAIVEDYLLQVKRDTLQVKPILKDKFPSEGLRQRLVQKQNPIPKLMLNEIFGR